MTDDIKPWTGKVPLGCPHQTEAAMKSCENYQASIEVLPVMCAFLDKMDCATCGVGDDGRAA